jgi:membrane-associated phospholipid phosphatase
MKNVCLMAIFLILQGRLMAQKKESFYLVPNQSIDTSKTGYISGTSPPHFKEWIIPAVLVVYGVSATHLDALTDVNETSKDLIWNKYPHKTVTIDNYLQFAPAIVVYGLNTVGIHGEHNFLDRTMIYLLSNVIMNTTVFTIKNISHEQRPNGDGYLSFPSGHTAEAFASADFLMQEYKNVSVWYGIGGYAVATSVAYLRMYNNKHWFSDVVAGAGIGILSTRLAYILYPEIKKIFSHTAIPDSVLMPSYQNNSFGFTFVHEFK